MYMYNTLNIAINPGTLQLELQCIHTFETGDIQKLYADHLAATHKNNAYCTIKKFSIGA